MIGRKTLLMTMASWTAESTALSSHPRTQDQTRDLPPKLSPDMWNPWLHRSDWVSLWPHSPGRVTRLSLQVDSCLHPEERHQTPTARPSQDKEGGQEVHGHSWSAEGHNTAGLRGPPLGR